MRVLIIVVGLVVIGWTRLDDKDKEVARSNWYPLWYQTSDLWSDQTTVILQKPDEWSGSKQMKLDGFYSLRSLDTGEPVTVRFWKLDTSSKKWISSAPIEWEPGTKLRVPGKWTKFELKLGHEATGINVYRMAYSQTPID